jgi:hypothetical protein
LKQIRKRLTYANVMSSVAVFLMLGGATAFAATKIGANQLKANSVKTGKIVKEAVTAGKLKKGAVTESRIGAGAVTNAKIATDAVTGDKVKESTLGEVPLASNALQLNGKAATSYLPRYAFVAANGTLAQGVGVENVFHNAGTGEYFVRFTANIENSGVGVTIINDGNGEAQANFRLCQATLPLGLDCGFTGQDVNNNRTIFVNTESSAGLNEDNPFSLTVLPAG